MSLWYSGKVSVSYTGDPGFQPCNFPFWFLIFLRNLQIISLKLRQKRSVIGSLNLFQVHCTTYILVKKVRLPCWQQYSQQVLHQRWIWGIAQARKYASEKSTLALKPKAGVTRSRKHSNPSPPPPHTHTKRTYDYDMLCPHFFGKKYTLAFKVKYDCTKFRHQRFLIYLVMRTGVFTRRAG